MDATCKTCPFWSASPEDRPDCAARECRVRSPAAYTVAMDNHGAVARDARWPWTKPGDWCGEHPLRQRDRLAAMAMQGFLGSNFENDHQSSAPPNVVAEHAHRIADAMLAARAPGETATSSGETTTAAAPAPKRARGPLCDDFRCRNLGPCGCNDEDPPPGDDGVKRPAPRETATDRGSDGGGE
jgi:hypothetical protein